MNAQQQQQQKLRWKLVPYGAQWAVTEEGTGYVILTRNNRFDAEREGQEHAQKAGVELIVPLDGRPEPSGEEPHRGG